MFVRRRPLARAAVIGGGAYAAGKRAAQRSAQRAGEASAREERSSNGQGRQAGGAAGPAPAGAGPATADQLRQLSSLHAHGALTDEEFAAARSRLLGS